MEIFPLGFIANVDIEELGWGTLIVHIQALILSLSDPYGNFPLGFIATVNIEEMGWGGSYFTHRSIDIILFGSLWQFSFWVLLEEWNNLPGLSNA